MGRAAPDSLRSSTTSTRGEVIGHVQVFPKGGAAYWFEDRSVAKRAPDRATAITLVEEQSVREILES